MTKPAAEISRLVEVNLVTDGHDLEAHMPLLRRVDAVRRKSAALRTDGLEALFRLTNNLELTEASSVEGKNSDAADGKSNSNSSSATGPTESNAGADDTRKVSTTPGMVNISDRGHDLQAFYKQLRVKWQYSGQKPTAREHIWTDIVAAQQDFSLEKIVTSDYPILAAAEAMRAFACVGTLAGSNQMMEAWYLIVRELFTATKPDWIIGGARAGDGGWVTAYSTAQCVQAICDLAEVLERTADLMVSMHRFKEQLIYRKTDDDNEEIDGAIPERWIEIDKMRILIDLKITINSMSHSTLLEPPTIGDDTNPVDYVCNDFIHAVGQMLFGLRDAFKKARDSIKNFRDQEEEKAEQEKNGDQSKLRKRGDSDANPYSRKLDGSKTGHAIAGGAITIGVENTRDALKVLFGSVIPDDSRSLEYSPEEDWILKIADSLRGSARGVRGGAETCHRYLSSVIDRQILASEPTDNRSWEPDELSFALSAYIRSSNAEMVRVELDRLRFGTKLICKDLSLDGTISNRIPFHQVESSQYYTNTEELLGAVSDVVRLTGYPIDEHVSSSIYHYFDRQCKRNVRLEAKTDEGTVAGWFPEFDHFRDKVDLKATIDAVESLGDFNRMLDEGINATILDHFNVKQPNPTGLTLDRLFYPDYGFGKISSTETDSSPRIRRDSVALTMQRMRAHVLRVYEKRLHSLVLHGPGGTGKTTLIEALANTCRVPLVEVTPSDIVERGEADIERRARTVFEALSMLSQVVILFDEFDPVLKRRDSDGTSGTNIYTFLTPGMLPKLKALNESAKGRRVAYALMTNLIGSLDAPAIRKGRFDEAVGIYPPDPLSRAGYMARTCIRYAETKSDPAWSLKNFNREAFIDVVKDTAGVGMTSITAKGHFRQNDDSELKHEPIGYIFGLSRGKPSFDEPKELFTKKLGEGPFADREALEWDWLTKWEAACASIDTKTDEYWSEWIACLSR
ncbi:ATP-binding protein [Paraburkholderia sp. J63]|uniref:ATP-binding protein n=1 Tax=Paraburkholderia sp. J63 TaxID=2805434 RepID=UPI002ABE9AD6|nr:ATP-binding protein [Paraburkholderia sp. J63]